jgi:hypothetical protein
MNVQEWTPGQILDISSSYWQTCTIHAAVKLDIFTLIGDAQPTSSDVAQKLNADQRAVGMFLNALTAMELLLKNGDTYTNAPVARTYLTKDSPQYLGHIVLHHHHLVDSWMQLDRAVRTGRAVRCRVSHSDEERRESFLMGMFNLAMNLAPEVVTRVDLSRRRHLLDLGGGPGTYAIQFCLHNPQLKASVYDLATTRPFAEKTIARFGLTSRVDFLGGDYLEQEITGSYDAAWLSHILHGESPEDCRKIIRKTVAALEPGGLILVHEFLLTNTMDGPLFPALFSLNMLLGTPSGQSYSEKQIMDMFAEAGVKEIRRIDFRGPNDSGIIAGIV